MPRAERRIARTSISWLGAAVASTVRTAVGPHRPAQGGVCGVLSSLHSACGLDSCDSDRIMFLCSIFGDRQGRNAKPSADLFLAQRTVWCSQLTHKVAHYFCGHGEDRAPDENTPDGLEFLEFWYEAHRTLGQGDH